MGWFSDLFGGSKQDEIAASSLSAIRRRAAADSSLSVVHVTSIQNVSAKGTKAWIFDERTGSKEDAFFWNVTLLAGQIVLGRPSRGWGPHTHRSDVVYFGDQSNGIRGVEVILAADTARRADRYLRRQQSA